MTAKEFNTLDLDKRGLIWNEHSTFLDTRIVYGKYKIIIYAVFNFYVEVFYNIKTNKIDDLKALENVEDFEGYMNSIKVELLY